MPVHRSLVALLLVGPLACGDAGSGDSGTSTGSTDPATGDEPTTAGSGSGSTSAGTGDASSGGSSGDEASASTSSSGSGGETSSGAIDTTSADDDTTAGETTTSGDLLCVSDTSADPAPWSLSHGVPQEPLGSWWVGGGAGSIFHAVASEFVLDLGGGPLGQEGALNVDIAAHSSSGEFLWSERIGGTDHEITHWLAASDCAGNIVVAGQFYADISAQGVHLLATGGLEYDEGNPFPTVDWFLMKFAPDGALLWAQRFGDSESQRMSALTLQSDGTIVVAGTVLGTLELGGAPIVVDSPQFHHAVLAAFTPGGAFKWQRVFASTTSVDLGRVDAGGDDRISVIAQSSGPVDLGGGVLPDGGEAEILAQFAADGSHLWSQRWQLATHILRGVVTDAANGAVTTGLTTVNDVYTEFIMRHDDAGAFVWERAYALEPDMDELLNIEDVLAGDEIVVLGGFTGTVDLGGGVVESPPPMRSLFLARYGLEGQHIASEAHAATIGVVPHSLARGPDGELVIGGSFEGTLDLGGGPLQSIGDRDLFVHRFAP